jgi:hypothetical protein
MELLLQIKDKHQKVRVLSVCNGVVGDFKDKGYVKIKLPTYVVDMIINKQITFAQWLSQVI